MLVKRTRAVWPLAAGAFGAVLLAAALLAGAPMYARAAAAAALEATLREAPVREAGIEVTRRLDAAALPAATRDVERALADTLGDASGLRVAGESGPLLSGDTRWVAGFYRDLPEHARLLRGRWPEAGAQVVDAVVSTALVSRGVVELGEEVALPDGLRVRVVGEYALSDPDDALWWGDPLALGGVRGRSVFTFGPLVLAEEDFLARFDRLRGAWRLRPDPDTVGSLELAPADVDGMEQRLRDRTSPAEPYVVTTRLATLLEETRAEVAAARTGALVPLIQLALLSIYGLVFVAGLMRARRRREEQLLSVRGASPRASFAAGLLEALALALPAALAAPWVAAGLLHVLGSFGPLADAGLDLEPQVDRLAQAFALAGGLACAAALTLPALSARGDPGVRGRRRPNLLQRSGADVGLLVLALVTLWQLRRADPVVARSGDVEVDLLLAIVPALGLFAGAVLAARLVPSALGLLERLAARRRGVLPALATRRLARGPAEHRTTILLLVTALALGTFAAAYARTWVGVQEDRAAVRVGADVLVRPDRRTGSLPAERLAERYAAIPGVLAAAPVVREQIELPGGPAELVAVDAAEARLQAGRRERDELAAALATLAGGPATPAPELEPRGGRVELAADVRLEPLAPDVDLTPPEVPFPVRPDELVELALEPALVVRDADGLLHRFRGPQLERPGRLRLAFDLAGADGTLPPGPLRLVALELTQRVPFFVSRTIGLDLGVGTLGEQWRGEAAAFERPVTPAGVRLTERDGTLTVRLRTGATAGGAGRATTVLRPGGGAPAQPPLPAVAGSGLLDALGARVGDVVELESGGRVAIAARLDNFPTVTEGDRFLAVGLPAFAERRYAEQQELMRPDAWLLAVAPGRTESVAAALAGPPLSSAEVQALPAAEANLRNDPVAVATIGALWLGVAAAALFAPAAFALAAAARARRESYELAAVQALGLSTRRVRTLLWLESMVVAGLGAVLGVALGLVLAQLVLPAVSFTETGEPSVPAPVVLIPWATIAALALTLAAAIVVAVAVAGRRATGVPVATALRAGEAR
jgi:hypothetical protein